MKQKKQIYVAIRDLDPKQQKNKFVMIESYNEDGAIHTTNSVNPTTHFRPIQK